MILRLLTVLISYLPSYLLKPLKKLLGLFQIDTSKWTYSSSWMMYKLGMYLWREKYPGGLNTLGFDHSGTR